jgi:hypothetical protein
MTKLLLRLPPPWPLLGAVQIWVDDALEPRLSHGEHEFISAREALSSSLSTVPWGSAFRVLVGSLKIIDRPAVLVEERWSAIPIWLHLGDVRLYTGHRSDDSHGWTLAWPLALMIPRHGVQPRWECGLRRVIYPIPSSSTGIRHSQSRQA